MSDPRRLLIEEPDGDVVFEVLNPIVVAGRDAGADLRLDDPEVSKRHCEFRLAGGRLVLRDLGSTNGTFVNGVQVSNAELKAGDVVKVGDHRLHVDRRATGAAAAPVRDGSGPRGGSEPKPRPAATTEPATKPRAAAAAAAAAASPPPAAAEAPPAAEAAEASTATPSRPLPRRSGSGAGVWVGVALLAAGAAFFFFRGGEKKPVVDPRLAEARSRLDGITALAEARGRRAALAELEAVSALGAPGMDAEIVRLRAAVEAAYADVAGAAPAPSTPAPAPGGAAPEESVAYDDGRTQFEAALAAGRYAEAARVAENSAQSASLGRALESALAQEQARLEAEFSRRKAEAGADAAREWLGGAIAKLPVQSRAYGDLQALLLTGAVAKAPAAKPNPGAAGGAKPNPGATGGAKPSPAPAPSPSGGGARPEPVATKDVPAGPELKSKLAAADDALAKGDLEAARSLLAALKTEAEAGGHRSLLADAERGLRAVDAEDALRVAIRRAVAEGARPEVPTADGVTVAVAADDHGLKVDREGRADTLAWRVLSVATMQALAEKLPLTPAERIEAAAVLFRLGKDDAAVRMLVRGDAKASEDERRRRDQVLADARRMAVPAEGFRLVEERFLSPAEFKRFELNATVERLKKELEAREAPKRRAAFEAFAALGPDARTSFHAALLGRRAGLDEALKKDPLHRKLSALRDKRAQVDKLRTELLGLIFDETNYPYPYRPPQATAAQFAAYQKQQALIDERTPVLKKAWADAESVAIGDAYREKLAQIAEIEAWLVEAEAPEFPALPGYYTLLPAEKAPVTVRSLALDAAERERIDASVAIMEKNGFHETASKGEIDQCRFTNEYRVMLGRRAVVLYGPLVAASRGHCQDMTRYSFFAHESPVPGKRSPADRMKLAGVDPRGGGENIAISSGPQGAFEGWRRSSGHHRNMVEAGWRYLGVGNDGRYWCQLFISGDGNLKRDPPAAENEGR